MKRPDWSRRLPRPLEIPGVMTLRTLDDVRKLFGHLPKAFRDRPTWQGVAKQLDAAARADDRKGDISAEVKPARMLPFLNCSLW